MQESAEPRIDVRLGDSKLTLLGTAHVSRASVDKVRELIESGEYDAVAVELCPSRYDAVVDPDSLARMDLFSAIRGGRAYMVVASLALAAYQQRLGELAEAQRELGELGEQLLEKLREQMQPPTEEERN